MGNGSFRLLANPEFYIAPLEDAQLRCRLGVERAAFPINGGDSRLNAALKLEMALYQYCKRKADLLRLGAYRPLPTIVADTGGQALVYRQLIVGPFEGRFLVRERDRTMLASLFLWHDEEALRGI